ncbi:3-methyl-2-oxobutanoate hydroxymethyltransferase [Rhodobacter maris]|uniref:3-methyl-2-oxobutanoate hydroxymethyltransferase n=1 Tax=Rhodobacter maris TaxID=446682 RepID=A0A285T6H5_9RHOB|nr:3-methyl-2-oxobutanoate hydroxymethyltransferase [Rhodobacter maris]SOC16425.1 ketopantoate hydroxymethyltransferase [Rhodobacter maris]
MSATASLKRLMPSDIRAQKGAAPVVVLTAYTTPIAKLADPACDVLLVGDSVGMVLHGLSSTLSVTMDMMILHGQAVMRGSDRALVVIDMPFGSYEESPAQAFRNAARILAETGAGAVKLEGGVHMAATIAFLVARGIPVMAHIGLTPQSVNTLGGYKVQGKGADAARLMADAQAVAGAGAFSVVIEKIPARLAGEISRAIEIPTIGIGAGVDCDGQVLVIDDMLGLFSDFKPKFVKRYAELGTTAAEAVAAYAAEVRAKSFPADEHSFFDEAKK